MADEEENKEEQVDQAEGEDGEEGEEGEGGKKSGKKKLIIIIALVVLLLGGGGAGVFFSGILDKKEELPEDIIQADDGTFMDSEGKAISIGEDGLIEETVYYDMEEFVVNLNVGSKRPSFLKMTISLELPGESQIPSVEEKMPRIRDSFQVYLRELRQDDLQGSAGLYRLREELLLRINKTVYPAKVNDILFKEILVQ